MNHCVVESLQLALDTDLLELKCNIHPLDGIAKKCVDTLKLYDAERNVTSDTFGKDACAIKFIYGMTKMRFKQWKGDQAGFKEFMRQEYIRPGMIVRYVGNRYHVMFHLAAVFFHLKEKLLKYLDNTCRCATGFRSALQKDLKNEQILLQLQALGLMEKLVTGPWMQQL